eukprot:271530_1
MDINTYQSNKLQIHSEIYTFNTSNDFAEFETEVTELDISNNNHCNNCNSLSDINSAENNTYNSYTNLTYNTNLKQQQKQSTRTNYNIHTLITAYIITNYNQIIHSNIINLCALFCTILDKFDIKTSLNTTIYGLNNTIAMVNSSGYILTNKSVRPNGKYRWSFRITDCFKYFQFITFSLLQNNKCIACHSIPAKNAIRCGIGKECYAPFGNDRIFYIYVDTNKQIIVFKNNKHMEFFRTEIKNKLDINGCKLCIFVPKQATIEMIGFESYDSADYYSNILSDNNRRKYIQYGLCADDIQETLMYFTMSLNIGAITKIYQQEYLYMLMEGKLFDNVYEFVYEYDIMCTELWDDKMLKQMDLLFEAGYLCNELEDINNAIKYYKMCIDYYNYDKYKTDIVCICIANLAQIYINMDESENAIETLRMLDGFIHIKDNNGVIYGNNMMLRSGVFGYEYIVNSVYNNGAELFKWYIKDRMSLKITNIKEKTH